MTCPFRKAHPHLYLLPIEERQVRFSQGTDGQAAWPYLTEEHGIASEKIIVLGRSLGAGIATYLASEFTPGGLSIESGFVSLPETAAVTCPWLPARWFTRVKYPNDECVQRVSSPVLFMHSREDEIIPFEHGKSCLTWLVNQNLFWNGGVAITISFS